MKFVWGDGQPHNVKGPGFKSKVMTGKGKSFSHKFGTKGTFKITCQVHPTTMKAPYMATTDATAALTT